MSAVVGALLGLVGVAVGVIGTAWYTRRLAHLERREDVYGRFLGCVRDAELGAVISAVKGDGTPFIVALKRLHRDFARVELLCEAEVGQIGYELQCRAEQFALEEDERFEDDDPSTRQYDDLTLMDLRAKCVDAMRAELGRKPLRHGGARKPS